MKYLVLMVVVFFVAGCQTTQFGAQPAPLLVDDIIAMSKASVPSEEIIFKMLQTRSVFHLTSDDILMLRKSGVSAEVVDFMMETYVEKVRRDQKYEDWSRWQLEGGYGYHGIHDPLDWDHYYGRR